MILLIMLLGWQLQFNPVQQIQVTEQARVIQPAVTIERYQGNSEDGDNLQPALGYSVLYQPSTQTLQVN